MAFYLPLFHNFTGAPCLLVGGGQTALRKLRWLVKAGADVRIVAQQVHPELFELAQSNGFPVDQRPYRSADVTSDLRLVISATNNKTVNTQVNADCRAARVDVNCVDQPELCTVIFPAIVERDPIYVAISSSAQSPTLARVVRGWIEQRLPLTLGRLATLAGRLRQRVQLALPDVEARKNFWEQLFAGKVAEQAMQGALEEAEQGALRQLDQTTTIEGRITLVGAGPGDPELLTLKALRAIEQADVILYDKLANPQILNFARRDATMIDVGKQGPKPGAPPTRPDNRVNQQERINHLLVTHATGGAHVVRLKGGDPYVYGRGGEEVEAGLDAGIDVEVIPGISAAFGAASIAAIPLTYRNESQSIRFITGHRSDNLTNMDWPELGRVDQTLVIYMGLVGLPILVDQLLAHGAPGNIPTALVENATLENERVIFAELQHLKEAVKQAGINGPSIVIIGSVVARAPRYTTGLYTPRI